MKLFTVPNMVLRHQEHAKQIEIKRIIHVKDGQRNSRWVYSSSSPHNNETVAGDSAQRISPHFKK